MKKIIASAAAVSVMAFLSSHACAADWSKTTYADGNPDTCRLISTDENGATWTAGVDGDLAKIMITIGDIVENEEDIQKIHHGSWNITYNGLSAFSGTDVGWLGGGTYVCTGNSSTYNLSPASWDEDGHAVWDDTVTVEDTFKWLLPSSVPPDGTAQLVFMDWSSQPLASMGVTLTVSDLKLYDKDGNEIPQKAYGASGDSAPAEALEAPAAQEAPSETAIVEVATTTSTATESSSALPVAGIMAAAAFAAVASRSRK
ncbi:MAG: hypothetical protein ILP19_08085 [Oscillospiraceae bacterium]|nr:hypothetical protein [Oscillospiraceae bacterium]